jgi:hypothetical protein
MCIEDIEGLEALASGSRRSIPANFFKSSHSDPTWYISKGISQKSGRGQVGEWKIGDETGAS